MGWLPDSHGNDRVTARSPLRRFGQNIHGVKGLDFTAFGNGKQDRVSLTFACGQTIAAIIGSSQSRD